MRHSLLRLAVAAAIGVLAAGAQAQVALPAAPATTPRAPMAATPGTNAPVTPSANAQATTTLPSPTPALPQATPQTSFSATPGPTPGIDARKTQAAAQLRTAQMGCTVLRGDERLACLREAQAAYDRALLEIQ